MRFWRALVCCALLACRSESLDPAPPSLDERLSEGRARAGVITKNSELIGGPTERGRIGDFKLYNSRIAVIVGRPGFALGYHPYGGTIIDADLVRAEGGPGKSAFGEVIPSFDFRVIGPESVEVTADGGDGGPAIVTMRGRLAPFPVLKAILAELIDTDARPIEVVVRYVLEPNSSTLRVEHILRNTGDVDLDVALPLLAMVFGDGAPAFVPGFGFVSPPAASRSEYYGAVSPDVTYLYGSPSAPLEYVVVTSGHIYASIRETITLRAREEKKEVQLLTLAVDLASAQAEWRESAGKEALAAIRGKISGAGFAGARVHLTERSPVVAERDYVSMTRADENGDFVLYAPEGEYFLTATTDARITAGPLPVSLGAGGLENISLNLAAPGKLNYKITDPAGALLPAKLTIVPRVAAGEFVPEKFGEPIHPAGTIKAEHGLRGEGTVELPAGEYQVYASRGAEYEISEAVVSVAAGGEARFEASLARSVSTPGWISTDTHLHAQLSPDSPDLFPYKTAALVVEGIELPVSTEHEAVGDFNPSIRALGVERWMFGIVGTEITTNNFGHFNAFPLVADPNLPGNGRIDWIDKKPAAILSSVRSDASDPFLQVNHPRSETIGFFTKAGLDRERMIFEKPDDGSFDFDGFEVANGCPVSQIERVEMADWIAFLNGGRRMVATGSTDNHRAGRGDLGYPRTWVKMDGDDPAAVALPLFRDRLREGRAVVSCGPYLSLSLEGKEIGDVASISGDLLRLDVRVAAPSWMDVDQIEVLVEGELVKTIPLGAAVAGDRFAGTITASITAGRDSWVMIKTRGDRRHGIWAAGAPSWAFTNPIFIDGNGDGRWR